MKSPVESALAELAKARFCERLWAKDASLWKKEPAHQAVIRNSLGWLALPDAMAAGLGATRTALAELRKEPWRDVVVLGMGGSSLACEVFRSVFGPREGFPRLSIVDSTNPEAIARLESGLDLKKTLFIVSSKSGSTIEPNCLLAYFYDQAAKAGGKPGDRFVAITDPGTSMEKTARELRFRKIFTNPSDIGGRFSALSLFGLVPAGLSGVDLADLLSRARTLADKERAGGGAGLALGAFLGAHARAGRDKLTLVLSDGLEAIGLWIEQIVAESTGKEGKGILPVIEPPRDPKDYGGDRAFVSISLGAVGAATEKRLRALERAGHPVHRLTLEDRRDLGAHFFLWEVATAAAGFLLKVNPFDQPDVQRAKDRTKELLARLEKGALPAQPHSLQAGGLSAHADAKLSRALGAGPGDNLPLKDVLAAHIGRLRPGDYCAILGYLDANNDNASLLHALAERLRRLTQAPVTVSIGPRYLHSTGQLYKGGSDQGLFLQIVEPSAKLPIPGERFDFSTLHLAQARGDFAAMIEADRRVLRLDPSGAAREPLRAAVNAADELQTCPS